MGPSPRCPRHPHQLATDLCVRCTEFVCSECSPVSATREVLCPECRALPPTAGLSTTARSMRASAPPAPPAAPAVGPSWRAPVALVLGLFSCTCFPAALLGVWFAVQALRQPAPNQSPSIARYALAFNLAGLLWSAGQFVRALT